MIIICNPQTYSTINIHLTRVDSVQLCRNENFSLPTFIFRGSSESFISILHELNTSLFDSRDGQKNWRGRFYATFPSKLSELDSSLQGVWHLVILSPFPLTEKDEVQQTTQCTAPEMGNDK